MPPFATAGPRAPLILHGRSVFTPMPSLHDRRPCSVPSDIPLPGDELR